MGYRLNRLDEPVFITLSEPLLTEFDIHHGLESCDSYLCKNEIESKVGLLFIPSATAASRNKLHDCRGLTFN